MNSVHFDNLMATVRDSNRDLQFVSENLPSAFHDVPSRGETEIVFKIAEEDVMRLRDTVDAITRQLLYRTWSPEFKSRIDESMKSGNWLFPR